MLDCWKANGLDVEAQLNAGVVTAALSLASLGDTFGGQKNPRKCHVSMNKNVTLILVLVHFSPEEGEVQLLPTIFLKKFFLTPQGPLDRQGRNKPMGHLRLARSGFSGEGEGWDVI